MRRIPTRTKIPVGVGVIVLAVVGVMVLRPGSSPPITANFVRRVDSETGRWNGLVQVSNCTSTAVRLMGEWDDGSMEWPPLPRHELSGHSSCFFRYDFWDRATKTHHIQISGHRLSGFKEWMRDHPGLMGRFGMTRFLSEPDFTVSVDIAPP